MLIKLGKIMAPQGDDGGGDSGGSQGGAIGTGNDARVAMLNAIGDSHDRLRAEELADIADDGTTSAFNPQPDPDADPAPAPVVDLDPTPAPVADPAAAPQLYKLKINGREEWVSLEEMQIRAQKVSSADEYLQQASQARRDATQQETSAPAVPALTKAELEEQSLANARKLVRAIQTGTEDEATAALAEVQLAARTPTITAEDVGRVADERLRFNNALTWFRGEYKDLVADPQLHRMVIEKESALVRAGDRRPYAERYAEVGNEVREWRDNLVKANAPTLTPAPAATQMETKLAAKAAAPRLPSSAGTKATPAVAEEDDASVSTIIQNMAKARGGPQWARA